MLLLFKIYNMLIFISKRELHLAAFLKANGVEFVDYKHGNFIFESEVPETELRVKHSNSDALRVDRELFTLKTFFSRE